MQFFWIFSSFFEFSELSKIPLAFNEDSMKSVWLVNDATNM